MKTFSVLIFSLLFSFTAFGQSVTLNVSYSDTGFTSKAQATNISMDSVREGRWVEYMDSDNVATKDTNAPFYTLIVFKHGKPSGTGRMYYNTGELYFKAFWVDGKLNGVGTWYYKDGKLFGVTPYTNNLRNGIDKAYYESGKLLREVTYSDDKKNGSAKDYYETGELKDEYTYLNDNEDGIEKEYYKNGKVKSEFFYTRGVYYAEEDFDENGKQIKH
jgi:antitoxin component YwqK of YwqJK toxin-antitoxin module